MKNTKSRNSASQSQADTKQIIRVCVLQPLGRNVMRKLVRVN